MKMKEYYSVETRFYDTGRIECKRDGTKLFDEKPNNTCVSLPGYDLYIDWFETPEEADGFVNESKTA